MAVSLFRLRKHSGFDGEHVHIRSTSSSLLKSSHSSSSSHSRRHQGSSFCEIADEIPGNVSRRQRRRQRSANASSQQKNPVQLVATSVVESQAPPNFFQIVLQGAVAGATAGVVVETVLYPIDTIKTRLQVARSGGGIVFKGLYSGLSGNLAGVLPASAIFVGVYEPLKRKLLGIFPDHLSSVAHLAAGAAGGLTASLVRVPTEVVKQRMQTGQFASAHGAVRQIVGAEGVRGLYAGFGSFLLRDLPFDAIQFCIYEQLRIVCRKLVKRDLVDAETAIIGAASGAVTGAVTTPLDVIKTRLMTQGAHGRYKGIGDCVSKIIQEEGAGALLKGVGPRVLWIGIGGSIFFAVLERTKQLLADQSSPKDSLTQAKFV
ncbi:unnamed protein product [Sphagnum jensenii]|uniref:Mitochondrial carrier protein n=1 Tax=Sphagnum jensenii TaxID=128206 RepID=A0ABP0WPE1_9BRYO